MGKHDYDIEDILLEAQMRKKQRQGSEGGKPVVPAAPLPAEMSRAPSVRGTLPVPAPFVRAEAPKPEAVPPACPEAWRAAEKKRSVPPCLAWTRQPDRPFRIHPPGCWRSPASGGSRR